MKRTLEMFAKAGVIEKCKDAFFNGGTVRSRNHVVAQGSWFYCGFMVASVHEGFVSIDLHARNTRDFSGKLTGKVSNTPLRIVNAVVEGCEGGVFYRVKGVPHRDGKPVQIDGTFYIDLPKKAES